MEGTAAKVHDVAVRSILIRKDDEVVYEDSGHLGLEKREEIVNDPEISGIEYRMNRRPGKLYRKYANNG